MEFKICAWYHFTVDGEMEKDFDYHYPVADTIAEAAKIVASEYGNRKRLFQLTFNDVKIDENLYL